MKAVTRKKAARRAGSAGRGFDRLSTLLAAVGIAAAFFPIFNIGRTLLRVGTFPGLLLYGGLLLAGYLLGLPFARRQKGGYDFSFEGTDDRGGGEKFRPLIPCLVILLAVFLCRGIFRRYCEGLPNYVFASPLPYVAMLFAAAVPIGGVFLAMRPFYKLLNFRFLPVYLTVFAIFGLGLPLLGYADTPVLLGSFLVWACCTAFVLNQTHLLESVKRAGNTTLPPYFRLYNFGMVLSLLGFSLVLLLLFSLLANGLFTVLKMIGYTLVYAFLNRDDKGETILSPSEETGGKISRGLFENAFLDGASVYFFLLIFLLTLCFFIFGRKYHPFRRIAGIFRRFMEFLNRLFDGLAGKSLSRTAQTDALPPDFVDEVKKQDPSAVYDRAEARSGGSYRDFERALGACKTDDDRLLLCYRRLLLSMRKMDLGIFPSDTPREILQKIRAHLSFDEAEEITALFEEIQYAERSPDPSLFPPLIEKMREMIKKYEKND